MSQGLNCRKKEGTPPKPHTHTYICRGHTVSPGWEEAPAQVTHEGLKSWDAGATPWAFFFPIPHHRCYSGVSTYRHGPAQDEIQGREKEISPVNGWLEV